MDLQGKYLRNKSTGVTGRFLKRYKVTGCGYSIMVECSDGRQFYAPEEDWEEVKKIELAEVFKTPLINCTENFIQKPILQIRSIGLNGKEVIKKL